MKNNNQSKILLIICLLLSGHNLFAQTDMDGLMMEKHFFCAGPTVNKSSWKNYWEGTFKRDNANLGTVSSSAAMIMGNYGVTDRLNLLFGLPYIKTKASAGNLKGQHGLQDLSLWVKWVAREKMIGKGNLKAIVLGGYSTPVSDYYIDLMPLAIGMHSKTGSIRLMADYEYGNWSATLSGAYMFRSNVFLDRNTYYTTEMHYTNEVKMPNANNINFRIGYRGSTWIAEAIFDKFTTLGGFDITKNNMPFVSNKMDATKLGLHVKYEAGFVNGLSFVADASTTVAGRNIGQSSGFGGGVFYIMDFSKKKKADDQHK